MSFLHSHSSFFFDVWAEVCSEVVVHANADCLSAFFCA
jgi:hypothetical protein